MKTVLKIVVGLPAVLFVVMGLRWLVAPADIAPEFGFVLGDGLGRSSQVGDFAAFFLTLGVCILMALVSGRRLWYYPPAMLLLLAAIGFVGYMVAALMWATLTHVFITMPKWRHYAETLTLLGADSLPDVHQRHRDEATQAEGFAEALDVGAAI